MSKSGPEKRDTADKASRSSTIEKLFPEFLASGSSRTATPGISPEARCVPSEYIGPIVSRLKTCFSKEISSSPPLVGEIKCSICTHGYNGGQRRDWSAETYV